MTIQAPSKQFVAGVRGIAPFATALSGAACVSPPAPPELNSCAALDNENRNRQCLDVSFCIMRLPREAGHVLRSDCVRQLHQPRAPFREEMKTELIG